MLSRYRSHELLCKRIQDRECLEYVDLDSELIKVVGTQSPSSHLILVYRKT